MPDVFSPAKRSAVMSRIRGAGNTATELRVVALFKKHGVKGWRRHQRVFGKPDFIFRRERLAVFIDGCFWHGCPKPKHAPKPKTRAEWWEAKLSRNKDRDKLVNCTLRAMGWKVIRIWECELAQKHWAQIAEQILSELGRGIEQNLDQSLGD